MLQQNRMVLIAAVLVMLPLSGWAVEGDLNSRVQRPVSESIDIRQSTQQREEGWRDDRRKLTAQYEDLERQRQGLDERRLALVERISAAESRIAAKRKELADIEEIRTRIEPLISGLIDGLRNHVAGDPPFLAEERRHRLEALTALNIDPQVTVSEKFRKVMEALLVEAEYGNTIEVYQQTIAVNGREMLVNIFRLGRLGLFFQTLDLAVSGFYDVAANDWQTLPTSYKRTNQAAIDIGAKRRSVELLTMPLGRLRVQ
ncbi:MAG: DUF3450 domain-containing protein [Proteobacteria bacterium]|nr:DUF3450 domain-containing protein [Pseudomonadota bacterium]MBU1641539.1 DUF3450 domain-containing protein [Pseudomonadota bacterium]